MTPVMLVDDHPPLRTGVAAILEKSGRYRVVAEAGSVEEALVAARSHRPPITVLDLLLPDGSGLDLLRVMKREGLVRGVLVLSMNATAAMADAALEAGADAYLLKESTGEHLLMAMDAVRDGRTFLDGRLGRSGPSRDANAPSRDVASERRPLHALSAREHEIFRLLASGRNSKEIARLLDISSKTVDNHRSRVMQKLELSSIADLVRLAVRTGVIDP